jgi:hypothetical protein
MFGNAAARRVNSIVYAILAANANMSDGTALFAGGHGNLAAGDDVGAPGTTTLAVARAAMRVQRDLQGLQPLNITPRYIIVPAALETTTEVILRSTSIPDMAFAQLAINPFQNRLEPVVESLLDAVSTTGWYLAADPNAIDTVEVAFLEGERAPYIEEQQGFDVDGRQYKVRLCVGAKAIDWRGLYYNPGV